MDYWFLEVLKVFANPAENIRDVAEGIIDAYLPQLLEHRKKVHQAMEVCCTARSVCVVRTN